MWESWNSPHFIQVTPRGSSRAPISVVQGYKSQGLLEDCFQRQWQLFLIRCTFCLKMKSLLLRCISFSRRLKQLTGLFSSCTLSPRVSSLRKHGEPSLPLFTASANQARAETGQPPPALIQRFLNPFLSRIPLLGMHPKELKTES